MVWAVAWVRPGGEPTASAAASSASLICWRTSMARAKSRPAPAAMVSGTSASPNIIATLPRLERRKARAHAASFVSLERMVSLFIQACIVGRKQ